MDLHKQLVSEYDRELTTTRKMLDAIPDDADMQWKANPKSMTLGRLAAHVAETAGQWGIDTLSKDGVQLDLANWKPWLPASKAEVMERFSKDSAQAKEILTNLPVAKWDETWKMTAGDQTWINDSRYNVFRTWVMNHMIHHRAQLGRDLRALGAKIPGSYGPSADDA